MRVRLRGGYSTTTRKLSQLFAIFHMLVTIILCYVMYRYLTAVDDVGDFVIRLDNPNGMDFIIKTNTCRIPGFNPWDSDYIPFIRKITEHPLCKPTEKAYDWTYIEKNELVLNTTKMKADGFTFSKGSCCYIVIERVSQGPNDYTSRADSLYTLSDCISITKERTEILAEYIRVECFWVKLIGAVAATNYHTITQKGKSLKVSNKIYFWNNALTSAAKPPSILIVGLDSTSRINFRRNMLETHQTLEKMGAVEMLGYTKAGQNSFENVMTLFTGYSEEDYTKICHPSPTKKLDDCPFIWKRFDAANYLTAYLEDTRSFNNITGFVRQPVDFYPRPLFQVAHDSNNQHKLFLEGESQCIGSRTSDEVLINYMEQLQAMAVENETPLFAVSWATDVSHSSMDGTQTTDKYYANFLQKLNSKGYLNNTILFFMSNSGFTYGPLRQTPSGFYEDRLPNMWVRLPSKIQAMYPSWLRALQINSRRLTSPFTMYWTLNLILDRFTTANSLIGDAFNSTKVIRRKHRQNFFQVVPIENTCADVGVPENVCPCYPRQILNTTDVSVVKVAVHAAFKISTEVRNISNLLCSRLNVKNIFVGAVEDKMKSHNLKTYTTTFITTPGDFIIEGKADFANESSLIEKTVSFQRVSIVNPVDIACIKDSTLRSKLEPYCYCDN